MKRVWLVGLMGVVVLSALAVPTSLEASRQAAGDRAWELPRQRYYLAHTNVQIANPTNSELAKVMGPLHKHTYAALHRMDGRGWFQLGLLIKYSEKKTGKKARVKHGLFWDYAVSYYRTEDEALTALDKCRLEGCGWAQPRS